MFTLIKNADLYTPDHMGRRDLLICNDKIVKVVPSIEFDWDGLQVIDAAGRRVIPGLIDQHVHITGGGGESSFKSRAPEVTLGDLVESGVTTVVGLLGTDSRTRSVRNVVAKAKALNEEGVTAYCLTGAYEYPSPTLTGSVTDDIVYIKEVIGVKIAISDHRSSNINAEELARLATQARLAGLESGKVGEVHMHMGNGKKGLSDVFAILEETEIPIKHFRPTHIQKVLEDGIKFANMGGYIDFTSASPTSAAAAIAKALPRVPFDRVTLSSDSNGSMPKWNEKNELIGIEVAKMTTLFDCIKILMQEYDVPMEQALALVTRNVAQALEIAPAKGCIIEGSDADLLLLNEDLSFHTVMARGRIMMEEGIVKEKGYYS
ncbi:MAG: beta-aspartyl-peptidase [Firmicutes bacterium]|nr:beta-aspartyl-peptidase [Bacillota bacterium]